MTRSDDDIAIRLLEHQLSAARAAGDALYTQGYAAGLRHSRIEVPEAFADALRNGSAQQHVPIPAPSGLTTVVLAQDGSGWPDERREAEAWEAIEHLRAEVADQARPGVRFMARRELPAPIGAVIWRWPDHTAVITTTTVTPVRLRLRAALDIHRSGLGVALVVAGALVRRLARGLTHAIAPTATTAAVSMAAATAIATAPAGTMTQGGQPRGHAVYGTVQQSPLAFDAGSRPHVHAEKRNAPKGRGKTVAPAPHETAAAAPPAEVAPPTPAPSPTPPTTDPVPVDPPVEATPSTPPPTSDGGDADAGDPPTASPEDPSPSPTTPDTPSVT